MRLRRDGNLLCFAGGVLKTYRILRCFEGVSFSNATETYWIVVLGAKDPYRRESGLPSGSICLFGRALESRNRVLETETYRFGPVSGICLVLIWSGRDLNLP